MSNIEQTLSIIKPDGVERNLVDDIKSIFTKNNLEILNSKKIHISKEEAAEFYKVHQSKPFYDDLCAYLSSGPIFVIILKGEGAVALNRKLMGATNPKDAEPDTIRKLYGISIDKNTVHGSDSTENAQIEINFFFKN
ncbi:MAG: nucleoside-diphosphate kinase [Pelagibacterales bacterium]|nr:nucleoside-diphosphate kinase [Pelagibacterales bacterium]|tara:strand:+ start:101 stop:511 length:411 start_codon:yes stop_codon:yes gene_type:complete